MTRLLLCTATILALTASANAQALITGGGNSAFPGGGGSHPGSYDMCARGECRDWGPRALQQARQMQAPPQRIKKKGK
jgi:hypothetical protein